MIWNFTHNDLPADKHIIGQLPVELILNSINGYAILSLDTDGNILTWNSGAERTKGYTQDEIIGKNFALFYSAADRLAGAPQRALTLAAENGRYEAEGWRVKKSGQEFWASVSIEAIRTQTGQLCGYVKVTRDIGERLAVQRLKDELNQAQKLDMVGQLTGGIAHDFNNLLTVIEGSLDLITGYSDDQRIGRIVDINRGAVGRSKKLIAQLLAFSRKQVLHTRLSDLNGLVLVFEDLLRTAIGARIELRLQLSQTLPLVFVDQSQLQAVLLNLVVNARDAIEQTGFIEIFTEVTSFPSATFDRLHDLEVGEYCVLGVRDSGVGMSDTVRERAIEPFFTTKDVGKGTGLGLSQAFGFAGQSNGALIIDSSEGNGTTIRILLPVASQTIDQSKRGAPPRGAILIVDDDDDVRTIAVELLKSSGHLVYEAQDAKEALDSLQRFADVQCVLTDIVMPGMNGLDLMSELSLLKPELRVVLTSGYSRDYLRDKTNLPDNTTFLQKPYSSAMLGELFDDLLSTSKHGGG